MTHNKDDMTQSHKMEAWEYYWVVIETQSQGLKVALLTFATFMLQHQRKYLTLIPLNSEAINRGLSFCVCVFFLVVV